MVSTDDIFILGNSSRNTWVVVGSSFKHSLNNELKQIPHHPTKQKVNERWMHLQLGQNVQEGEATCKILFQEAKGLIATGNCQEKLG